MSKLEHIVHTRAPYNKVHADPKKNYGVGSMIVWFIVKGPKGAVQFQLNTGGYLESVVQKWHDTDQETFSNGRVMSGYLQGWDLGYHSPKPKYKDQSPMGKCDVLPDKCYYDGSSLNAEEPLAIYLSGGDKALWEYLETYYCETFEGRRP